MTLHEGPQPPRNMDVFRIQLFVVDKPPKLTAVDCDAERMPWPPRSLYKFRKEESFKLGATMCVSLPHEGRERSDKKYARYAVYPRKVCMARSLS